MTAGHTADGRAADGRAAGGQAADERTGGERTGEARSGGGRGAAGTVAAGTAGAGTGGGAVVAAGAAPVGGAARGVVLDPLAALRTPDDPPCDVYLTGTVFLDIIFTGLDSAPVCGTETWARGMGSGPGGVANMATALSRLGLRTSLAAAFGDDVYGDHCWDTLSLDEGIDLSPSRKIAGWHSPVTVSMAYDGERTMVSHGHDAPPLACAGAPPTPPPARACVASLVPGRREEWIARAHAQGSRVFADVGWDESGRWDPADLADLEHCEAFLPNAAEAVRYTRTDSPEAAARALAELVPVAVVTTGRAGAVAVDSSTGESAAVPALAVEALDPTGAGDVFVAGYTTGALAGWPLADRLAFANLTAALSVQEFGGALAAPGWAEIAAWWKHVKQFDDQETSTGAGDVLRRYAFLDDLLPGRCGRRTLRRAVPTIGFGRPAPGD
ncbi:PfkB family carbohydrate kinase [Streptomyces sp. HB2AG]|uniref:PfkB family carbohydrate kinase n=1 Tax=Streptomyces sp. HB2AG TaxID=2983400 RepID=UPI0022AA05A4|nr:PfkB family carbohydrate kinase [Streptomyces sp. HB2AG]MCZ2523108.1 PfkB family carbohydrate kinase [Streptomyces sp. HB2AG]